MSCFIDLRQAVFDDLKTAFPETRFFKTVPVKTALPYVRVSFDAAMVRLEDATLGAFETYFRIYVDTSFGDSEKAWLLADEIASHLESRSYSLSPHSMSTLIVEQIASHVDVGLQLESVAIDISTVLVSGE